MKEDLNHAVGVVASLYRSELQTRPDIGPFTKGHPFADPKTRNKLWISIAELHQDPVGLKVVELRRSLSRSYGLGGARDIASVFSGLFDQDQKRVARQLEGLGVGFKVTLGIGEREMFLADILNQRMPVPLKGEKLHLAKSVLLSELLGSEVTVDFVPVEYKYPDTANDKGQEPEISGNAEQLRFDEILRLSRVSRLVSRFAFGDIIRAVLEGRIGLEPYRRAYE